MEVTKQASDDNRTVSIKITGRFDFSSHRAFRKAYDDHNTPGTTFEVDLSGSEYIDSSALGMLLLLKEFAEASDGEVVLVRPSDEVEKILNLANFHRLFPVRT